MNTGYTDKGNLGIPSHTVPVGLWAVLTGQGDGELNPLYAYAWRQVYWSDVDGVWLLMNGESGEGKYPYFSGSTLAEDGETILDPALEVNRNDTVPFHDGDPASVEANEGAVVWLTVTYVSGGHAEFGFAYGAGESKGQYIHQVHSMVAQLESGWDFVRAHGPVIVAEE